MAPQPCCLVQCTELCLIGHPASTHTFEKITMIVQKFSRVQSSANFPMWCFIVFLLNDQREISWQIVSKMFLSGHFFANSRDCAESWYLSSHQVVGAKSSQQYIVLICFTRAASLSERQKKCLQAQSNAVWRGSGRGWDKHQDSFLVTKLEQCHRNRSTYHA